MPSSASMSSSATAISSVKAMQSAFRAAGRFKVIKPTPSLLFEFSSFVFFIVPMAIMVFLYLRMGFKIRKTASFGKNTAVHGESKSVQSKKAILKMLGEY